MKPLLAKAWLIRFSSDSPFPKRKTLDSSKLKDFEDDNFKFDEYGGKFMRFPFPKRKILDPFILKDFSNFKFDKYGGKFLKG